MSNPFLEKYAAYSAVQLLEIIAQQNRYQAEAVAAAKELLNAYTDEEVLDAQQVYKEEQKQVAAKEQQQQEKYREPLFNPHGGVNRIWWVNFFCVYLIIEVVIKIYNEIDLLVFLYKCVSCKPDYTILGGLLDVVLILFIVYLVFRRNRWGWALLVGYSVFILTSFLTVVYALFQFLSMSGEYVFIHLAKIVAHSLFLVFLQSPDIRAIFGVGTGLQRKAIAISAAISLLIFASMAVVFYLR